MAKRNRHSDAGRARPVRLGYKLSSEERGPRELVRLARLAEESKSHHGRHFTVENARLYSRPETPPPLLLAVGGPRSADLAGSVADGMVGTDPSAELIGRFDRAGGAGKPRYAELTVCWNKSEAAGRRLAKEVWPTAAMESSLSWELPLPAHFEAVAELVTEAGVAESIICGPDPKRHLAARTTEYVIAVATESAPENAVLRPLRAGHRLCSPACAGGRRGHGHGNWTRESRRAHHGDLR